MKQKSTAVRILVSSVVLAAVFLISTPVADWLNGLTASVTSKPLDWNVPFRLVMMAAALVLVSGIFRAAFCRWSPKNGHGRTAFTLANSAVRYILVIVGLMWGLAILGVDVQALLAGAGVAALIIGFGAESLIADVITGIFMLFEHQYEVGDIIVVGDFRGTVTQIGIRTTSITDSGGNVQIINNSDIRNLVNRSNDSSFAVCDIAIPYRGCLKKAEGVLAETLPQLTQEYPEMFEKTPQYLGVQEMDLANDAVLLRVAAEVSEQNIYAGQRALNRALLLAFEEAGISKPVAELKLARE